MPAPAGQPATAASVFAASIAARKEHWAPSVVSVVVSTVIVAAPAAWAVRDNATIAANATAAPRRASHRLYTALFDTAQTGNTAR